MSLFDKTILPIIKKRWISVEDFEKTLKQKEIYGHEAEKFVFLFEKSRNNSYEKIRLNSKIRDLITSKFFDEFDKLSDCERNIFFYSDNFKKKSIFPGLKFFTYPCENIGFVYE